MHKIMLPDPATDDQTSSGFDEALTDSKVLKSNAYNKDDSDFDKSTDGFEENRDKGSWS